MRLIITSNISRRQFLKGAGAAALAVAATGVLAGCSKDDIPDTPDTPVIPEVTKEVKVIFMCNGATAGNDGSVVVKKDAKTVPVSLIKAEQIPQGYTVESTGELKIKEIDGKECVLVTLKKIATSKNVTVAFYDTVNNAMLSTTMTIAVASDAEFVYKTDLKEALPGYEIIDNGKNQISENNRVVMAVKPVAPEEMRNVTVTYRFSGSNGFITDATVDVPMSKKFLTKAELPAATVVSGGYLFDVVPTTNGPFGINDLGDGKGEVAVTATIKMHK